MSTATEIWLPIANYEGLYEVSSLGNVRSLTVRVANGSGTRIRNGRVLKFNVTRHGYATVMLSKDSKEVRLAVSRLVAEAFIENMVGTEVDHINRDRLDNRLCNLRKATSAQNKVNRGMSSFNTSGYKGVSWHKARGKWRATMCINGVAKHLGHFDTVEDAAACYEARSKQVFGEFSNQGGTP